MNNKNQVIQKAKLALYNCQVKLDILEKQKNELLEKYENSSSEKKNEIEMQIEQNQQEFKKLYNQTVMLSTQIKLIKNED